MTPTYENNGVVCIGDPQTFSISVLSEIEISGSTVDALDCNDPNSGNINITVTGGSGVYDFLWSNGAVTCLLYTSPSPRDGLLSRMPSSA